MQIDAVYENGLIKPEVPLRLKSNRVKVRIIVSDDYVLESGQVKSSMLREKINTAMGAYRRTRPDARPQQDKAAWHKHLEQRHER